MCEPKAGGRNLVVGGGSMSATRKVRDYIGTEGEGEVTKLIEAQTARVPSGTYLSAAILAMGVSAVMMLSGRGSIANFIGQWAPTILILGLYNKLVKLEGSE
jgi:hypothetical protein